ncbi:MAG TPA: NAD(P)-dependent oxidoreductase, partial [Mucilaginibacter sp.]|nr:NAD(P)-dependent oxidoreductase [Mucilaginibacter sp.]
EVRLGQWIREGNRGTEFMGKTVGIIGYGNMGSTFAQRLRGFGVKIFAYDKYKVGFGNKCVNESNMEEIFSEADVLSIHLPLTAETEFLVNDSYLHRFRKNIYLINTARGRCVKTDDLVKNLKSGKVLGACLDVNEYEDSSFERLTPGLTAKEMSENETWNYLIHSDKVILTPHIAGWSHESNEKMARVLAEKILTTFGSQRA